jgi:hypothetical protein
VLSSFVLATLLAAPLHPEPVPPGSSRYYFILFAGQSVPFIPQTAHTWATFVKATPQADGTLTLEVVTISWLPVDGKVRVREVRPAQGRNYSLEETFAIMLRFNAQISYWGPFEIDAERYQRAVEQVQLLQSGVVRYRVLDSFRRKHNVAHCVHAVTYADPVLQWRIQPVLRVGEPGTSKLAAKYLAAGAFIGGAVRHEWVAEAIGLTQLPAIPRQPGEHIRRRWLR